ncbi:MAG: DUF2064 domain-containing protein, partial [Paracoccaceae bacterium]
PVGAAWWFRHASAAVLRRLAPDPRWETVLAVAPDVALGSRALAPLPRIPQGRGDLGARMARLLRAGLARGAPVLLMGADIPGAGRPEIAAALAALRRRDAVLAPATDGGFWLAGLRPPGAAPAALFGGCRWSTPHALADAARTLAGRRIAHGPILADVDDPSDLARPARART